MNHVLEKYSNVKIDIEDGKRFKVSGEDALEA
jgi:hypothetical protein